MTEIYFEGKDRDLERPPVWAQRYIEGQAREIRAKAKRIEELSSKFPGTNVRADPYSPYPEWTLPPDSHISFRLGADWMTDEISIRINYRGRLAINGSKQITVHPTSGNACEISFDNR